ncbi:MAG: ABC transporter ATP-binding protein [Caldilineaceae bacterium]|nr:ABC transporter ATP-binding protein [Caldilineaceae bacterium]
MVGWSVIPLLDHLNPSWSFPLSAIEFRNVEKRFGQVEALQAVNLSVRAGEFVSLVGPSGCGKTTMLRIVAGLDTPTAGSVQVNGASPAEACRQHQVGVAFQRPALIASRTALANVKLTLEITGRQNSLSPETLLQDFGLGEFLHHYPHQLSGGMQQRVNIAAALVHNPNILLLDEPFGALDELTRETMGEWLGQVLLTTPKTVIFVTHSVEEAAILSDRVVVLSARPGRISDVLEIELPRPRSKEVRMQENFLHQVARVREALYRAMPA